VEVQSQFSEGNIDELLPKRDVSYTIEAGKLWLHEGDAISDVQITLDIPDLSEEMLSDTRSHKNHLMSSFFTGSNSRIRNGPNSCPLFLTSARSSIWSRKKRLPKIHFSRV
jgi:hypothetical protein